MLPSGMLATVRVRSGLAHRLQNSYKNFPKNLQKAFDSFLRKSQDQALKTVGEVASRF